MTDTNHDQNQTLSIAWPFFLRLPRGFRLFEAKSAPRPRESRATLRDRFERDVAAFASVNVPLTRFARH